MEKNRIKEIVDFILGDDEVKKELLKKSARHAIIILYKAAAKCKEKELLAESLKNKEVSNSFNIDAFADLLNAINPQDIILYGRENVIKVINLLHNEIIEYHNNSIKNITNSKNKIIKSIDNIKFNDKEQQIVDILNNLFNE